MADRLAIEQAFHNALGLIKMLTPKDTRNLVDNAVKGEWQDDKTFHIYVDENIAPYMVYTNEPWTSTYWGDKQNPNEHWWNNAAELVMDLISYDLNGVLKNEKGEILE